MKRRLLLILPRLQQLHDCPYRRIKYMTPGERSD